MISTLYQAQYVVVVAVVVVVVVVVAVVPAVVLTFPLRPLATCLDGYRGAR